MYSKAQSHHGDKLGSKQRSSEPIVRDSCAIWELKHSAFTREVLQLQRTIGNRAVQRVLEANTPTAVQAKLAINAPKDSYEQEADDISKRVMSMKELQVQRACAYGSSRPKCRKDSREHEHADVRTKSARTSHAGQIDSPAIVQEVLAEPGHPLDAATRAFMEPRFGHDFSQVRMHTDEKAAESASALNALAYTVGQDIVFGRQQNTLGSREGREVLAHELTHVIQQGSKTRVIQRKDGKKKKAATTNPKSVFNEIRKRNPDLATLITPQSIDFNSPKEPPVIKAGPLKDGEEHIWKVRVTASQGFRNSQITEGEKKKTKFKGNTQVSHFLDIMWALPLASDPEFVKATASEDEAFTLTAAEPLYHELLHARIMMERDPNWTIQHTQVFQDFASTMQIAASPAVDTERQALKKQIGIMARGGGQATTDAEARLAEEKYYEFLVHEKFDADTESKPFGKSYSNALIARKYSEVVAMRFGLSDPAFRAIKEGLSAAAEKLFDKLDQANKSKTPSGPSKQPEKE